jgi:hypothetical protein
MALQQHAARGEQRRIGCVYTQPHAQSCHRQACKRSLRRASAIDEHATVFCCAARGCRSVWHLTGLLGSPGFLARRASWLADSQLASASPQQRGILQNAAPSASRLRAAWQDPEVQWNSTWSSQLRMLASRSSQSSTLAWHRAAENAGMPLAWPLAAVLGGIAALTGTPRVLAWPLLAVT